MTTRRSFLARLAGAVLATGLAVECGAKLVEQRMRSAVTQIRYIITSKGGIQLYPPERLTVYCWNDQHGSYQSCEYPKFI